MKVQSFWEDSPALISANLWLLQFLLCGVLHWLGNSSQCCWACDCLVQWRPAVPLSPWMHGSAWSWFSPASRWTWCLHIETRGSCCLLREVGCVGGRWSVCAYVRDPMILVCVRVRMSRLCGCVCLCVKQKNHGQSLPHSPPPSWDPSSPIHFPPSLLSSLPFFENFPLFPQSLSQMVQLIVYEYECFNVFLPSATSLCIAWAPACEAIPTVPQWKRFACLLSQLLSSFPCWVVGDKLVLSLLLWKMSPRMPLPFGNPNKNGGRSRTKTIVASKKWRLLPPSVPLSF